MRAYKSEKKRQKQKTKEVKRHARQKEQAKHKEEKEHRCKLKPSGLNDIWEEGSLGNNLKTFR